MANTLIQQLEEAERQADSIRQDAAKEARDLVKSVEEAVNASNRQSMKDIHTGAQLLIEEARIGTSDEIKGLEAQREKERAAMKAKALKNVDAAGKMIFERVVLHGNR